MSSFASKTDVRAFFWSVFGGVYFDFVNLTHAHCTSFVNAQFGLSCYKNDPSRTLGNFFSSSGKGKHKGKSQRGQND